MHHKRGKPKSSRSGCLMCKPQKHQRLKGCAAHQPRQEMAGQVREREERKEAGL